MDMKSFFKRSAISIIVLGITSSAYAAVSGNNNLWPPHLSGAFIGVEGLNLRPMNGDIDYVTTFPTNFPSSSNGGFYTRSVSPSYDWAWRVFAGVKFTENDDLTLSWMSLSTSDHDAISPQGLFNGIGLSVARWLDGENDWNNINGRVTFDLDDAYAVWGHSIRFNNPWSVRFAAGLEYAKLDSKLSVTANDTRQGLPNIGFESHSNTKGIGPRVEFNMAYQLPYNFALFGKTNAALFYSSREVSIDPVLVSTTDLDNRTFVFSSTDFPHRHVVIPKFGMRLGASYSYVWGQAGAEGMPCRTTTLTVDAGWQVESYIHAIERPNDGFFSETNPPRLLQQSVSADFATTKTSNFSDQGLFIGISLGTDWV